MSNNDSYVAKAPYWTGAKIKLDKKINEEVFTLAKERLKETNHFSITD